MNHEVRKLVTFTGTDGCKIDLEHFRDASMLQISDRLDRKSKVQIAFANYKDFCSAIRTSVYIAKGWSKFDPNEPLYHGHVEYVSYDSDIIVSGRGDEINWACVEFWRLKR